MSTSSTQVGYGRLKVEGERGNKSVRVMSLCFSSPPFFGSWIEINIVTKTPRYDQKTTQTPHDTRRKPLGSKYQSSSLLQNKTSKSPKAMIVNVFNQRGNRLFYLFIFKRNLLKKRKKQPQLHQVSYMANNLKRQSISLPSLSFHYVDRQRTCTLSHSSSLSLSFCA